MQLDRKNWTRDIRADMKEHILDFTKNPEGEMVLKRKIGEKWIDGASYFDAFLMAYKRVAENMIKFSKEPGSSKFVAIPLYSLYIVVYSTVVPLYPVIGTMDEAKKLKEPIIETVVLTVEQMEEYLEPIDEAHQPPLEFMMIKARHEESVEVRRTVAQRVSMNPTPTPTPEP